MALGKPVVVNDSEALQQAGFRDKENAMMVPVQDPEAIARAVVELAHSESLREEIGKGARQLFMQRYTPEKVAASFLNHLKQIEKRKNMKNRTIKNKE